MLEMGETRDSYLQISGANYHVLHDPELRQCLAFLGCNDFVADECTPPLSLSNSWHEVTA